MVIPPFGTDELCVLAKVVPKLSYPAVVLAGV